MRAFTALLLCTAAALAAGREVAITIDDLPRGGDGGPERSCRHYRDDQASAPAISGTEYSADRLRECGPRGETRSPRVCARFWICGWMPERIWGITPIRTSTSTTCRSMCTPRTSSKASQSSAKPLAARGKKLEFYRHPFLFTGPTAGIKKQMQEFLVHHGYRIAPVTIDDGDYEFAALYTRSEIERPCPARVCALHGVRRRVL